MEGVESKLRRIQDTICRLSEISDKLKDGDISPGMRQSLRRQYIAGGANLRHQVKSLNDFVSGSYVEIIFKVGEKKFMSSFVNCTKEQAENILRSHTYGNLMKILEIREKFAHPQPVEL